MILNDHQLQCLLALENSLPKAQLLHTAAQAEATVAGRGHGGGHCK